MLTFGRPLREGSSSLCQRCVCLSRAFESVASSVGLRALSTYILYVLKKQSWESLFFAVLNETELNIQAYIFCKYR